MKGASLFLAPFPIALCQEPIYCRMGSPSDQGMSIAPSQGIENSTRAPGTVSAIHLTSTLCPCVDSIQVLPSAFLVRFAAITSQPVSPPPPTY